MKISGFLCISTAVLLGTGAALAKGVDMKDARRVVGTDNGIRIDAQIMAGADGGSTARVTFEVENLGDESIAVADLTPDTDYDADSRTLTVNLGSEIPTDQPTRLVRIDPHQKVIFSKGAAIRHIPGVARLLGTPQFVRVKLNFLRNLNLFQPLLGGAQVPSADLFPAWVDNNDTVITNSVPLNMPRQSDSRFSASHPGL